MAEQRSYYPDDGGVETTPSPRFVKCNSCYGSGEDRHGLGDCLDCEGYGDIEVLD